MRLIDDERRRLLSLNQRPFAFAQSALIDLPIGHLRLAHARRRQAARVSTDPTKGPGAWYGPAAGTINEGCSNDNVDGSLLPSRRVVRLSSRHRDAGRCLGGVCLVSPSAGHMVLCYARCRHGFVLRPMSTPLTHLSFNTYGEFPFSHCRFTHTLTH